MPLWTCIGEKIQNPDLLLLPNVCATSNADALRRLSHLRDGHAVEVVLVDCIFEANKQYPSITLQVYDHYDILLGIFVQGHIQRFHTEIGGNRVQTTDVGDSGFYPVLKTTFLPLLGLMHSRIVLVFDRKPMSTTDTTVRLAYGKLGNLSDRRRLCHSSFATAVMNRNFLTMGNGVGNVSPYVPDGVLYYLPQYDIFPGLKEKIKWQHVIDEELMQVTWHPKRFTKWCLHFREIANLFAPVQHRCQE